VIALMRPNGREVYVNPDLIETAERDIESGATVVLLTTGNTLVVVDDGATIAGKISDFRRGWAPRE
jgi:uncharacterized protein YlzI (FlbEa/FlbD family)